MKKTRVLALAMIFIMVMTTACSKSPTKDSDSGNVATPTQEATEQEPTKEPSKEVDSDEEIVLTFASWALGTEEDNNLERRLIAAYEEAHPNVTIQLADDIITSGDWNGSLTTAAAGGTLPDVACIASLPTAVANEWAYDVTSLVQNDTDWANIPSYLANSGSYNEKQFGIPAALHLAGFFINNDLFEAENVNALEYGYSLEDWESTLAAMSTPSEGVIALKHADVVDWLPFVNDSSLGWFTYDGKEVHLNSPAFINAVKYSTSLNSNGYAFNGLTADQKSAFGVESDWEAWNAGLVAMAYDGTWASSGYAKDLSFDVKFVGLPNNKSIIVPDYMFIGKTTEHPEAAYDFAKYMTFGKEGILERIAIDDANDTITWSALPLTVEDEIIEAYFKNFPVEGVREVFEDMEGNSIVEAFKFTPGYIMARWNAPTGIKAGEEENANIAAIINQCMSGNLNINDYAEQLNSLSNQYIAEEAAIIDSVTK